MVVQKPTIGELLDANWEYLEWLETEISAEAANAYKQQLQQLIAKAPPTGTKIPSPLRRLGDSLIWPYTSMLKGVPMPSDPINLILWNKSKADDVYDKLVNYFIPPLHDVRTCSGTQYTYVDNSKFGGYRGWIKMKHSLANCVCLGFQKRCHIRLFDSVDKEPRRFGYYTIAGIHYEELEGFPPQHKIRDWDNSQRFLVRLFLKSFPFVGSKGTVMLQQPGEILQGVAHDGIATAIELR